MKRSEIYREAARRIEQSDEVRACCRVLSEIQPHADSGVCHACVTHSAFEAYFGRNTQSGFWWPLNEANRDARVLALCFMSAIAESEGQ